MGQYAPAERREVMAVRVKEPPKIDGKLNDLAWNSANVAHDFVQHSPFNGRPSTLPTEVRIVYDDQAIYFGASLYDNQPDSIYKELSERDRIGITDWFGVQIDCFNDFQSAFGFYVTASGVQTDKKLNFDGRGDNSWDAVWKSAVSFDTNGWFVEMKIPYSAIRFPDSDVQLWGLQFYRYITRYREKSSWNLVRREVDGENNQAGLLGGLNNLTPPLRLSLVPYVSAYAGKEPQTPDWSYSYNYGMDMKLGLNESFTLDVTLIPDFGQVESDDKIYNLSPFEVYYNEKRPFFTEGTELFNKGGVFYSRRIGGTPGGFYSVGSQTEENETVTDNPGQVQLINASKLYGKTKKNLSVGLFNAMTAQTEATLTDTVTGEMRHITTEPFTNYNMIVLDQALPHNSFASFYNTNVWVPESSESANVTGVEGRYSTRSNEYSVWGEARTSQKFSPESLPDRGYSYAVEGGRSSGNLTWELSWRLTDDHFDQNDMGFLRRNNLVRYGASLSYNIYEPNRFYLDWHNNLSMNYGRLYRPDVYTDFGIFGSSRITFRNYLTSWFRLNLSPVENHDYYEPRNGGWYLAVPSSAGANLGISPDYRKKFLADVRIGGTIRPGWDQKQYQVSVGPRLRLNNNFMLKANFRYNNNLNGRGYVTDTTGMNGEPVIFFGKRDVQTIENVLEANYRFNHLSSVNFRLRHYWITVNHTDYYTLNGDGTLAPSDYYELNQVSVNLFNIDMSYVWNFAPGSELRMVWKNSIDDHTEAAIVDGIVNEVEHGFGRNLMNTLSLPASNSFSVKVLYYIDYQQVRKLFSERKAG
ncbi:MAG: hypothetical protein Kow00127_12970 [Bacteroidales bacterium]